MNKNKNRGALHPVIYYPQLRRRTALIQKILIAVLAVSIFSIAIALVINAADIKEAIFTTETTFISDGPEDQAINGLFSMETLSKNLINITITALILFSAIICTAFYLYQCYQRQFEKLAFTDPVTNGRNSASFQIGCMELLKKIPEDGVYCVVSLNIKNFRLINEGYGSREGNDTLRYVARVIRKNLSDGEISGRGEADNFYLFLRESSQSAVQSRLDQLIKDINSFNQDRENPYYLVFSQGAYLVTDASLEVTIMQDRANTARKEWSSSQGGCAFYHASSTEKLQKEREFRDALASALENREFQVYLQPKIRTADGRIGGAEALIRWQHPQKGLIPPSDFIPVFEKNGTIQKLDFFVFEEVCKTLNRWIKAGCTPIPISFNLSRHHFREENFLQKFEETRKKYGIPAGLIEMELTESVFFHDKQIEIVKNAVNLIHRAGFLFSLDDFGSGFSSLGLLKNFNVDSIKLDRRFFLDETERSHDVVESIINLAKKLGVHTVAEGIESSSQLHFLRQIQCDLVQGYLYSKPLPIPEFELWCKKADGSEE